MNKTRLTVGLTFYLINNLLQANQPLSPDNNANEQIGEQFNCYLDLPKQLRYRVV